MVVFVLSPISLNLIIRADAMLKLVGYKLKNGADGFYLHIHRSGLCLVLVE